MKLNQTYPLMDLLDALTAASDNTRELAKQLKAEGRHMTAFTVYEAENDREVGLWLGQHGIDVEKLSDGGGWGYEELSYGNDVTDELCAQIEQMEAEQWK